VGEKRKAERGDSIEPLREEAQDPSWFAGYKKRREMIASMLETAGSSAWGGKMKLGLLYFG